MGQICFPPSYCSFDLKRAFQNRGARVDIAMTSLSRILTRSFLSIALICLVPLPALAIEAVSAQDIDAIFSDWQEASAPGAAVGVFLNGETLYSNAFGVTHIEQVDQIDLDTRFNIASVSKTFTAFAVLLLEEQSKLSLQDDIRKYLPEIYDFGEVITIDDLLTHSSGIRNWGTLFALSGVSEDDAVDSADILQLVSRQRTLNHSPGARATYSNSNYFLLALIVERISGKTFREFTTENIFAPLGMTNTFYSDDADEAVTNRAWGHATTDGINFELDMPRHNDVGSSNLLITMNDFAIWEANLNDPRVGSHDLVEKLYTRGFLDSGLTSNYARGTGYGTYRSLEIRGMQGGEPGYRSSHTQFLESGLSIVILSNATHDIFTPFTQVAALYLGEEFAAAETALDTSSEDTIPSSIPALEELAGAYLDLDSHNVVAVYADTANGNLVISGSGLSYRVRPSGLGTFESIVAGDTTRVEFDMSSNRLLRVMQNDVPLFVGNGMPEIESTQAYKQQFVGLYHSDELNSSFQIELRGADLYRTKAGMPARKLDDQFQDLFQAEGGTGTMLFERNGENEISGFRISVANIFNLYYQKR